MPRTLEDIFYEVISTIKKPLHERVKEAFFQEEDRILRHKGVLEEVRRLETQRDAVPRPANLAEIEATLKALKGPHEAPITEVVEELEWHSCEPTEAEIEAFMRVAERPEGKNHLIFLEIERVAEFHFRLADSDSEKRTIIQELYTRDWSKIGITLPFLYEFKGLTFKDGFLEWQTFEEALDCYYKGS